MPKAKSSPKPKKPYPDFPLTPRGDGRWCKRIRGKLHYFKGDWKTAKAEYESVRDTLQAGGVPVKTDVASVAYCCNAYMDSRELRLRSGKITQVTFNDYRRAVAVIAEQLGRDRPAHTLTSDDFDRFLKWMLSDEAKGIDKDGNGKGKLSESRRTKYIIVTRQVFNHAEAKKLLSDPPDYGTEFVVPSKRERRMEQNRQKGKRKLFKPAEIRALLDAANAKWKAIILLCLNGGMGNSDIARLPLELIEGDDGSVLDVLDYARGKTGSERRFPLWPETQKALAATVEQRPTPQSGAEELVFLSDHGGPMIVVREYKTDLLAEGFKKLCEDEGLYQPRRGLYTFRRMFETIAGGSRDQVSVDHIMGHTDDSMAATYRHGIQDDRLKRVTDHVRAWLYAEPDGDEEE